MKEGKRTSYYYSLLLDTENSVKENDYLERK